MCKKSLRTAVYLHERLTEGGFSDGSYSGLTGDDRKPIFNEALKALEPDLNPCPFCGGLPYFEPESGGPGYSANYYGGVNQIACRNCDLIFKGYYPVINIINQWNDRIIDCELENEGKV